MNMLRNLVLSGVVFFTALPFFSSKVKAELNEIALTVKSSFSLDNQYYVCLSDNSHFILNKELIHKASGWFDVDKYGNPAANWLIGDPINIERTGEYEWPFHIVNLYTNQRALAASVNFEVRNYERMHDRLRDLLNVLKEMQRDISAIKYDIKNMKEEVLFKKSTPVK